MADKRYDDFVAKTSLNFKSFSQMDSAFDKEDRIALLKIAIHNIMRSSVVFGCDGDTNDSVENRNIFTHAESLMRILNQPHYGKFMEELLNEYEFLIRKIREE